MILRTIMIVLVGALFAAGAASVGYAVGMLAFPLGYGVATLFGSGAAFENDIMLLNFATGGGILGFLAGALVFAAWHRAGAWQPFTLKQPRLWTVLALAPIGAICAGLAPTSNMLLGDGPALLGLFGAVGALLAASAYGALKVDTDWAKRFFGGLALGLTLAMTVWIFVVEFPRYLDPIVQKRIVWVNVAFPVGSGEFADPPAANATLRTATRSTPCRVSLSRDDTGGHPTLFVACEFDEWTEKRTLVLTFPDRPEVSLKLALGRRPSAMAEKSAPQAAAGGITYRYSVSYWRW